MLHKSPAAIWMMAVGQVQKNERCKALFSLPEFSPTKTIEWEMHVGTLDNVHYDMIIGNDLLQYLKIDLKYSTSTIEWDGIEIPMRLRTAMPEDSYFIQDQPSFQEAADRIKMILDAKYQPADLAELAANCTNLNKEQQEDLHTLVMKYKSLFDGTLGQWMGEVYNIELKEGATPYHARPFPVPRVYEQTF